MLAPRFLGPGGEGELVAGTAQNRRRDSPRQSAGKPALPTVGDRQASRNGQRPCRHDPARTLPDRAGFRHVGLDRSEGGLGAEFERAMVSEIVGINAVYGVKTSSRIDPLSIQLKAGRLFATVANSGIGWTLDESIARKEKNKPVTLGKDGRPSEAITAITPPLSDREKRSILAGGVTIDSAEQTVVLSLPALRRPRFPVNAADSQERDNAARTVLAALGLCAAALASETGLDLRSRCLLWPIEPLKWELLGKPGGTAKEVELTADAAITLLKNAIEAAKKLGLPWRETPLVLTPSPELVKLIVKSQQLAVQQGGENGEGSE